MTIKELTSTEEQVMLILWKLETAYMKDILAQSPEPKPHPNTLSTYMKILISKGFVEPKREGRVFKYCVAVPFEKYRREKLDKLVRLFFNSSHSELLQYLEINSEKVLEKTGNFAVSKKHANEQELFIREQIKKLAKKKKKKKK